MSAKKNCFSIPKEGDKNTSEGQTQAAGKQLPTSTITKSAMQVSTAVAGSLYGLLGRKPSNRVLFLKGPS